MCCFTVGGTEKLTFFGCGTYEGNGWRWIPKRWALIPVHQNLLFLEVTGHDPSNIFVILIILPCFLFSSTVSVADIGCICVFIFLVFVNLRSNSFLPVSEFCFIFVLKIMISYHVWKKKKEVMIFNRCLLAPCLLGLKWPLQDNAKDTDAWKWSSQYQIINMVWLARFSYSLH